MQADLVTFSCMLRGNCWSWQVWMGRERRVRHPSSPRVPAAVTHTVTSLPRSRAVDVETMSRKIGRIGDWNNNSQSGSDRLVSWFDLFEATSNANITPETTRADPGSRPSATPPIQIHQQDST